MQVINIMFLWKKIIRIHLKHIVSFIPLHDTNMTLCLTIEMTAVFHVLW